MWPDLVSNSGLLALEPDALRTALRFAGKRSSLYSFLRKYNYASKFILVYVRKRP